MIRQPMSDLGLHLGDEDRLLHYLLETTGGLPQIVQFYGAGLVNLAAARRTTEILPELIREFEEDFETAQFMLSPVYEICEPLAQSIVRAMLADNAPGYAMADVQRIAERLGQPANPGRIANLCNDLVIQNFLTWESHGAYRLANKALRRFARRIGLLDMEEK
jgi:hypothetical protein